MIYPWQQSQWQQLTQAKQSERLPHALLFTGISGIGKLSLAEHFASAMLCEKNNEDGSACGKCRICKLVLAGTHPDWRWLRPEKTGQAIKVDQVREITEFIQQSPLQGDYRIVIIHPADSMNASAANALLKTLEEPTPDSLLILVSSQVSSILPTILSRCQRVAFSRPDHQLSKNWLAAQKASESRDLDLLLDISEGAPLKALAMLEDGLLENRAAVYQAFSDLQLKKADALKLAVEWKDMDIIWLMDLLFSWLMDTCRLQAGQTELVNRDFMNQIKNFADRHELSALHQSMNEVLRIRKDFLKGIHLNKQLIMESILLHCFAD